MGKIRSHTSLRGIAALCVLLGHYRVPQKSSFDIDQYTLFFSQSYLWVDMFFILSGFIMAHVYGVRPGETNRGARSFLRARFARVYPLHFATLLFVLLFQLASAIALEKQPETVDWFTFFLNVANVHGWGFLGQYYFNTPSWSISVEFAAYLLFIPFCLALRKSPRATYAVTLSALFLWLIYDGIVDTRETWERLNLLRDLPLFFLGAFLYRSRAAVLEMSDAVLGAAQALSAVAVLMIMCYGANDVLIVLPFASLIVSTQTDRGLLAPILTARPAKFLGDLSYSIYLLHIPVLYVFFLMWPQVSEQPEFLPLVSLVATMIVSHFSFKYFETPLRRWINETSKRRAAVTA